MNQDFKIFTSEDFVVILKILGSAQAIDTANIANKKIASLLGPKVYGEEGYAYWLKDSRPGSRDTHQAYLFNVQKIEKKPCEHEPTISWHHDIHGPVETMHPICRKCGKKLVAKWSEVE